MHLKGSLLSQLRMVFCSSHDHHNTLSFGPSPSAVPIYPIQRHSSPSALSPDLVSDINKPCTHSFISFYFHTFRKQDNDSNDRITHASPCYLVNPNISPPKKLSNLYRKRQHPRQCNRASPIVSFLLFLSSPTHPPLSPTSISVIVSTSFHPILYSLIFAYPIIVFSNLSTDFSRASHFQVPAHTFVWLFQRAGCCQCACFI